MNYDKSIEILQHHARYGGYHISDENNIMIQNDLKRAKKVEELLGLKDKHISHLQSLYASTISHNSKLVNQWSAEVQKVQSEIWKLEKELEAIK